MHLECNLASSVVPDTFEVLRRNDEGESYCFVILGYLSPLGFVPKRQDLFSNDEVRLSQRELRWLSDWAPGDDPRLDENTKVYHSL